MPLVQVNEAQVYHIREGRPISIESLPDGPLCGLLDLDGNVFSAARVTGNMLQPECVIPAEAFNEPA